VNQAGRHDRPLAAVVSSVPADLKGENLVVYAAGQGAESVLDRFGAFPAERGARVHLVTGTVGVLASAPAGVGVAVMPAAAEYIDLPDIIYRPPRDMAAEVDVVMLSRGDERAGPVREFLRSCDRAAGA